jgi:predicted dehydrogenase
MRFALLGDHADGLAMACALMESGRHSVTVYAGPRRALEALQAVGIQAKQVADMEEILADPAIQAVIVAGPLSVRSAQLRRVLQSERHAMCVYPPDVSADSIYEASMIRQDTGVVLLPILPDMMHPALARLAGLMQGQEAILGEVCLLELERHGVGELIGSIDQGKPTFSNWDVVRRCGGEIAEVFGYAEGEEPQPGRPVLIAGQFAGGALFRILLMPRQAKHCGRIRLIGAKAAASVEMDEGFAGRWRFRGPGDERGQADWERWSPWPALVEAFEQLVQMPRRAGPPVPNTRPTAAREETADGSRALGPTWQDAIRGLELDDAVRRSIKHRRAGTLEYQEASEEVSFKGTMTLVGCGILWGLVLLAVLARWFPKLGWIVIPLLFVFLLLQLLRWLVPRSKGSQT